MADATDTPQLSPADRAAANVRLAYHVAAPFARRHPEIADDIESAALLGLLKAARGFDPDRGVRFASYAGTAIRRAICRTVRVELRHRRRYQQIDVAGSGGESVPLVELTAAAGPEPGEAVERADEAVHVRAVLASLPSLGRDRVERRLAGERAEDIAAADGVSRTAVTLSVRAALRHLRARLAGADEAWS